MLKLILPILLFYQVPSTRDIDVIVVYQKFVKAGTPAFLQSNLRNPPDSNNINVKYDILDKASLTEILSPKNKKRFWPGKIAGVGYGGYYTRVGSAERYYFYTISDLKLLYSTESRKYYKAPDVLKVKL